MTTDDHSDECSIHIQGNVDRSVVILGDGNIVTCNVLSPVGAEPFPAQPSQPLSKEECRWRQVLIQNVKHYWIEGVLERSLHNHALIELGLEDRSQAVASPINGVEEFATEIERPFPEGTQATDIFDDLGAGRTLLILGEPGAGKTTTLLKLTKTLLTRIGDDFSQPIPVVLNLSSWAIKRQSIAEWLVQALYETFKVSKSLGATWIREEQLTLCLDGLDEVAAQYRNACLQALNHFLQDHGRTEVVVCCRIRDYEALSERVRVRCAIYVQPLTTQQIDRYLKQAGEQLSALSTVFSHNPEIKSFAASPLILSVMSLAYHGCLLDEFPDVGSAQAFRQRLFDTYVKRMFMRRGKTRRYTDQQAKYWLFWIAQRMVRTSQTVFFIENMQPSWLQTSNQRLWYRLGNSLVFGLGAGLMCIVIGGLSADLSAGLINGLINGLIVGLSAVTHGEIKPVETLRWSWEKTKISFRSFLFVLIGGLIVVLIGGLIVALAVGLVNWLIGGLGFFGLVNWLIGGLIVGTFFMLIVGTFFALISGLKGPGIASKTKPNQGIWRSARNAEILTLIGGLIGGLIFLLIEEPASRLVGALIGALIGGLGAGLLGGGSACLRHFSLRLILYRIGYIPWNYARFLDYATERLFLQKVGGGYIFIHRMLLEHFAQMEIDGTHR